ncbi:MAG: hypothetical protein J2P57_13100 [Acidimicrobiaceae bacterium]|nr:hypothetical protein [Acidimicrobiaceae bacterium]
MSDWADVSAAVAGGLVTAIGALVPYFVGIVQRWASKQQQSRGASSAGSVPGSPADPGLSPPSSPPENPPLP